METELDAFARLLMRVRDQSISHWDRLLDGDLKGVSAEQVREELRSAAGDDSAKVSGLLKDIMPSIVDIVLFYLLWEIEQAEDSPLRIFYNGKMIDNIEEVSDGLAGELFEDEGWIASLSESRRSHYR